MRKKMIIAGGTGYLGQLITDYFSNEYEIYILTRSKSENVQGFHQLIWDGKNPGDWSKELENCDVLINLAGKNINTRFTDENKTALLKSRIESTGILGKSVEKCTNPPKMWLNASSVAIYPESWESSMDEDSPTNGKDFLSELSRQWENEFNKYSSGETIKCVFRISLILGDSEGSAYRTLKTLVKTGGGGAAGDGQQIMSWIGEKDFVRALHFIIENKLSGAVNMCNTNPLSNKEFMRQLRLKYKVPVGIPAPEFLVKIGAQLIGTAPDLILRSQHVLPKRLIEAGFNFEQPSLSEINKYQ